MGRLAASSRSASASFCSHVFRCAGEWRVDRSLLSVRDASNQILNVSEAVCRVLSGADDYALLDEVFSAFHVAV